MFSVALVAPRLWWHDIYFIMTHPNIVFSPRQRITQGNIGSFTGPIPMKYGKFIIICASRVVYIASRLVFTALRGIMTYYKLRS